MFLNQFCIKQCSLRLDLLALLEQQWSLLAQALLLPVPSRSRPLITSAAPWTSKINEYLQNNTKKTISLQGSCLLCPVLDRGLWHLHVLQLCWWCPSPISDVQHLHQTRARLILLYCMFFCLAWKPWLITCKLGQFYKESLRWGWNTYIILVSKNDKQRDAQTFFLQSIDLNGSKIVRVFKYFWDFLQIWMLKNHVFFRFLHHPVFLLSWHITRSLWAAWCHHRYCWCCCWGMPIVPLNVCYIMKQNQSLIISDHIMPPVLRDDPINPAPWKHWQDLWRYLCTYWCLHCSRNCDWWCRQSLPGVHLCWCHHWRHHCHLANWIQPGLHSGSLLGAVVTVTWWHPQRNHKLLVYFWIKRWPPLIPKCLNVPLSKSQCSQNHTYMKYTHREPTFLFQNREASAYVDEVKFWGRGVHIFAPGRG